jgi:uncharacterized protein YraI
MLVGQSDESKGGDMKRVILAGLVLCLLGTAACGDDGLEPASTDPATTAATTTAATPVTTATTTAPATTTTTLPPTTTTFPWEVHDVAATTRCVIGHRPGDDLNVRSGPSTDYGVVGTLPHDGAAPATGLAAYDDRDREWIQVGTGTGEGWAAGWLLTANECLQSAPAGHCVVDTVCTDRLNVREGPSGTSPRLGSLAHDAVDVAGTGWTTTDGSDRTWVQIEWQGGVAWAAGWFLTEEPCAPSAGTPCVCPSDGSYWAMVHSVDHVGRFLEYDPVTYVWIGPSDTEYEWDNSDTTVFELPIASGVEVMACPPSDPLYCDPPDPFVAYPLADLAGWIEDGTEIGQNRRYWGEIPAHTGQFWRITLDGCSVTEIEGIWFP